MKEKTKEKRKGTLNVQNALSKLCHAQVCTKMKKKDVNGFIVDLHIKWYNKNISVNCQFLKQ